MTSAPYDEVASLSAARRASRTPPPVDEVGQREQAWAELYAQQREHGGLDTPFAPAWRDTALFRDTAGLLERLLRSGPDRGPDVAAMGRLLHGIGPNHWPQAVDARAYLWHTTVMTWRSANVPPMLEAHRLQVMAAFVDAGLDPNAQGPGLFAPLYIAVSQRDLALAQALVERGASIPAYHQGRARSSPDMGSVALLNLAAQRNDPAMCAWLLEQGVPLTVPGATLPQPLETAREHEAWNALQVLEQAALRTGLPDLAPSDALPSTMPRRRL